MNYMKAKIDNTKQCSKCCGYRDETDNHISECSKLSKKEYKTKNHLVRKVFKSKVCKRLKSNHTTGWYLRK